MSAWISEHKGVCIAIVGVLVIALAVAGVIITKGKGVKTADNPVNNTADSTDTSAVLNISEEFHSQVESSDVTNDVAVISEKVSETETTTEASVQQTVVPTGVESLTDGNKKVYYPAEIKAVNKKYPVIVWANGTGMVTDGYDGLLKKIADGGYIVVADSSVMTADGTSQINSIDYITEKNSDSNSIFYGKVDTGKIGATGHSQGGRSSVNAAQKDKRIKCIVSIAGASSAEEANGLTTPALFLTGTADMVVVSSQWCKPSYDAVSGRAVYASLKGAGHTVCMTNPEKVSGYVVAWFDAYLKNDSTAKAKFQNGGQLSSDSAWQDFASKN